MCLDLSLQSYNNWMSALCPPILATWISPGEKNPAHAHAHTHTHTQASPKWRRSTLKMSFRVVCPLSLKKRGISLEHLITAQPKISITGLTMSWTAITFVKQCGKGHLALICSLFFCCHISDNLLGIITVFAPFLCWSQPRDLNLKGYNILQFMN